MTIYTKRINELIEKGIIEYVMPIKPGEWLAGGPFEIGGKHFVAPLAVYYNEIPHETLKYMVGRSYAVNTQPTKKTIWYRKALDGTAEWQYARPGVYNEWKPLRVIVQNIKENKEFKVWIFTLKLEDK